MELKSNESFQIPVSFERTLHAWSAVLTQTPARYCPACKRMERACAAMRCPRCGGVMHDITAEYVASVCDNFGVTREALRL